MTTTPLNATSIASLQARAPTTAHANVFNMGQDWDGKTYAALHEVMRWNIGVSAAAGKAIQYAQVTYSPNGGSGSSTDAVEMRVYKCLRTWVAANATWNQFNSALGSPAGDWATAGGVGAADIDLSVLAPHAQPYLIQIGGTQVFITDSPEFRAIVQDAVSGTLNILVKKTLESDSVAMRQDANPQYTLRLTYDLPSDFVLPNTYMHRMRHQRIVRGERRRFRP